MSKCCPNPVGLAVVAENPWFIIFAYVAAFLPWGWLYALDYISDVWKTMRDTRISGYWHLFLSAPSLAYIIAYAHVQRIAGDFKEMMTAVVAIIMCLYHIARTSWGLMQLAAFRAWCQYTMECMYALRMNSWCKEQDKSILKSVVHHQRPTFLDIESLTQVNNTCVDNELKVSDLVVLPAWMVAPLGNVKQRNPSRFMTTKDPKLCTVRWTGAFLCAFGSPWRGGKNKLELDNMFERAKNSLWALLQTTIILRGEHNGNQDNDNKKNLFSILQVLISGQRKSIASHAAYNTDITNYRLFQTFAKNANEYNNLINMYPASNREHLNNHEDDEEKPEECIYHENRKNLVAQLVDSVALANHLGTETLEDIQLQKETSKFPTSGTEENAWNILLEQKDEFYCWNNNEVYGEDEFRDQKELRKSIAVENVPQFPWNRLLVALWEKGTNWRVLQTSAHEDIVLALYAGRMFHDRRWSLYEGEHECVFQHIRETHPRLFPFRFIGVTLETVRSFLAEWVRGQSAMTWMSPVPNGDVEFFASKYIADEVTYVTSLGKIFGPGRFGPGEYSFFKSRLIWECQYHLQSILADSCMKHANLPASAEMIMLFLLAFPVLHVSCDNDNAYGHYGETESENEEEIVSLKIETVVAVQNIYIEVLINKNTQITKLRLMNPANESEFHWNDWVNSAMATIEGYGETLKNQNKPVRIRPFRKVHLDDGWMVMRIGSNHGNVSEQREKEVETWKGWPPFDMKICQYEVNKWLAACNLKWKRESDEKWWSRLVIDDRIEEIESILCKVLNSGSGENNLENEVSLFFNDDGDIQIR